jgi:hypothetical protein
VYALILLGAIWVMVLVVLVLDLSGLRRRGPYLKWQAAGLLLVNASVLAELSAEQRGWSFSSLHVLHLAGFAVVFAGLGLFGVGLRVQFSARDGSSTQTLK